MVSHLYPRLLSQLKDVGRSQWPAEFFELFHNETLYQPDPAIALHRFMSHIRNEREFFFASYLAPLREKLAQAHNLNRTAIVTDGKLAEICQKLAAQTKDPSQEVSEKTEVVPNSIYLDGVAGSFCQAFLEEEQKAFNVLSLKKSFKSIRKEFKRRQRSPFSKSQQEWIRSIKLKANEHAQKLMIPLAYLCPSALVEDFVLRPSADHALISGWRAPYLAEGCSPSIKNMEEPETDPSIWVECNK
jgi:ribonuclease D